MVVLYKQKPDKWPNITSDPQTIGRDWCHYNISNS